MSKHTSQATIFQGKHTLQIITDQDPSEHDLIVLHDGYLTNLVKGIKNGTLPPIDEFCVLCGLTEPTVAKINYGATSFEEMLTLANFDSVDERVNGVFFPLRDRSIPAKFEIQHFPSFRPLPDSWFAARTEHALAFAALNPELVQKYWIAAEGAIHVRSKSMLAFGPGVASKRSITVVHSRDSCHGLHETWRILGIREIK